MQIAIGSDHVGYSLKEQLKPFLSERGLDLVDCGTDSDTSCSYPGFAHRVAEAVASGSCELGILICGTGIGMSIAANKVHGIRCALVHDVYTARLAGRHNDANVLAMGATVVSLPHAKLIIAAWLDEEFEGGRHNTRLQMIKEMER